LISAPIIDVCLVNDRHPNHIGPISGLPLVGLGSLAAQTSIVSVAENHFVILSEAKDLEKHGDSSLRSE
jgi:hypothetical protein